MTRKLVVRSEAERDIRDAHEWYSSITRDLGEQFITEVENAFERITDNPSAFPILHRSIRRSLLRRFPYAVFFVTSETRVAVIGVLHQARNPRIAQRRR